MDVTYEEFKKQFETELMDQCAFLNQDVGYTENAERIKEISDLPKYLINEFYKHINEGVAVIFSIGYEELDDDDFEGIPHDDIIDLLTKHGDEDIDYNSLSPLMKKIIVEFLSDLSEESLHTTLKKLGININLYTLRSKLETFVFEFYNSKSFDKACDKAFY